MATKNLYYTLDNTGKKNIFYKDSNIIGLSWDPTLIMGNILWLDAATVVLRDSYVSQWTDKSGQGNHATQVTETSQPAYVTDALNNNPVLRFDGNDDYMINSLNLTQPLTVFVLWTNRTISDDKGIAVFDTTGVAGTQVLLYQSSIVGGNSSPTIYAGDFIESTPGTTKTRPYTIISTCIFNTTTSAIYENGNIQNTGDVGNQTSVGMSIGTTSIAPGYELDGDIAEIIIYNRVLSADERLKVENYLNTKYALY